MARVTYVPLDEDEVLDLDPTTKQPMLTRLGPRTDDWMILLVLIAAIVVAAVVVLIIGLGFMDLAFGNTG